MIEKTQEPQAWSVAAWHSDFGDAHVELEHLRCFAVALLSMMPRASVELGAPEPGLMNLAVELPNGILAEVYSIPVTHEPGRRRLGLFLAPDTEAEREIYADSIEGALSYFTDEAGQKTSQH